MSTEREIGKSKEGWKIPCHFCKKEEAGLQCSRCTVTRYCQKECQASDWEDHKKVCMSQSLMKRHRDFLKMRDCFQQVVSQSLWGLVKKGKEREAKGEKGAFLFKLSHDLGGSWRFYSLQECRRCSNNREWEAMIEKIQSPRERVLRVIILGLMDQEEELVLSYALNTL